MKIGVLVQSEEMGRLCDEIGQELDVEVRWMVAEQNDPFSYVERLIREHNIDAVIARNPTGYLLEETLPIPVVILHITRFDLIRAAESVDPGKHSAFMYMPQDSEKYNYYSGEFRRHAIDLLPATEAWLSRTELTQSSLEKIGVPMEMLQPYDAILSATLSIIRFTKKIGKQAVLIPLDPFDLRCAFRNAMNAVRVNIREKQSTKLVEMALNSTEDSFLILRENQVIMASENLCAIAGMPQDRVLFRSKTALTLSSSFLRAVFSVARKGIVPYGDASYSVFRRTVGPNEATGGETLELISLIHVQRLQHTENAIRRAMNDRGFDAKWCFADIVAKSQSMENLIRTANLYAKSDGTVLITGETGTGKEVFAQSIHNASSFASGPFVALNCAALPENLLESELFGYDEGAFTGAKKGGKAGLVELSHGGTLFLDEIGELAITLQAKLLRCIQERCVYRLGGNRLIPVQNRIICATNQDLFQLAKEKKFRMDLLYRINILRVQIPPLRERREDVFPLVLHTLQRHLLRETADKKVAFLIASLCQSYPWPGNVRELEGIVERLSIVCRGRMDLPEVHRAMNEVMPECSVASAEYEDDQGRIVISMGTMENMEQQLLRAVYFRTGKNKRQTARSLGLGYNTVLRKLREPTAARDPAAEEF